MNPLIKNFHNNDKDVDHYDYLQSRRGGFHLSTPCVCVSECVLPFSFLNLNKISVSFIY